MPPPVVVTPGTFDYLLGLHRSAVSPEALDSGISSRASGEDHLCVSQLVGLAEAGLPGLEGGV